MNNIYISEQYHGHLIYEFSNGTSVYYEVGTEKDGKINISCERFCTKDLAKVHIDEFLNAPERCFDNHSNMKCSKCGTDFRIKDQLSADIKENVTYWLLSQRCFKCKTNFVSFIRILN